MKYEIQVFLLSSIVVSCMRISVTQGLKYVWGDALDDPLANGPDGNPYPWDTAAKVAARPRNPKLFSDDTSHLLSPAQTREILLKAFMAQERGEYLPGRSFMPSSFSQQGSSGPRDGKTQYPVSKSSRGGRTGRAESWLMSGHSAHPETVLVSDNGTSPAGKNNLMGSRADQGYNRGKGAAVTDEQVHSSTPATSSGSNEPEGCVPSRLCPSTYNTTAPLYGVSLTSGQPVTIVQKFPDLLQQVVFQTCKTSECDVIHGECVQTYLPYLFLVIPLGPVTLTGQDYVLIESGCVCRPKYAKRTDEPPPIPFIQPLQPSH